MSDLPPVDFATAVEWSDSIRLFPPPQSINRLKKWLRDHPENMVCLYHGTAASHPIMHEGLLPASRSRRRNWQSRIGFVYLSIFPSYARMFAQMAYPGQPVKIYRVKLPVRVLRADPNQLTNQYLRDRMQSGNSLAESIAIGHGVRVKGAILPWAIHFHTAIEE